MSFYEINLPEINAVMKTQSFALLLPNDLLHRCKIWKNPLNAIENILQIDNILQARTHDGSFPVISQMFANIVSAQNDQTPWDIFLKEKYTELGGALIIGPVIICDNEQAVICKPIETTHKIKLIENINFEDFMMNKD